MAIINSYPLATPKVTDLVLGTSTSDSGQTSTKSFTVQSIKDTTAGVKTIVSSTLDTLTISGSGTSAVTIGTLTAAVTDVSAALTTGKNVYDFVVGKITGTADTVPIWTGTSPSTTLGDSLISQAANAVIINGNSTDAKLTLNCSAGTHGVTFQSPPHSAAATYTLVLPQATGTAGQVLTSGGGTTDQLVWSSNGNVGGTGTANRLSKWSDATTLADSNIEDTGTLVTISSAAKVTGNLELDADLLDVNGNAGGVNQLLSSLGAGNGVDWVNAPATGVLTVTDGNTAGVNEGITIAGTAANPTVAANIGAVSSSSFKLATGEQIQTAIDSALAGAVTFKGTFNANTGQITGGSNYLYNPGANSNTIAVAVGDMYVVSVAGNFFGNASTALNVGDEIIAVTQSTIGPSNSQESYYNAVPSQSAGGTVTTFSTVSTAYPGITTAVTNPTTTPELTLGLGTNAAAGKYLDGGTGDWTTLPSGDTYDLNATTDGSNVDLNLTSGSGTDNSTVQLTAGAGMTITQSGGNNITLAAASSAPTRVVNRSTPADATTATHDCGTVNQTDVNYIDVYVGGVYQNKDTYTAAYDGGTGKTTITLTGGAFYPNGATIESITI